MDISKFTNKTNKIDGVINTEEEEVSILNGVYIGNLIHDNANKDTINIYTGSKLTGDKIDNYFISTPSETPWKYSIKVLANVDKVYISYEYTGDTVEAEDINNLQDAVVDTQNALNSEIDRANAAEKVLTDNLNSEISRAKAAENVLTNTINTNKPNWDNKYTKSETDNKISAVVTGLDYKEHVATFADLSTTYPNAEEGWTVSVDADDITYKFNGTSWIAISANSIPLATSSVDGKMSKSDKSKMDGIEAGANKYVHPSTHPASMITQDATHRMVTDEQISNWNDAAQSGSYAIATGTANVYAVTLTPAPTAYTEGMALCVKINITSTGASTLNVNGLGAKSILDSLGNPITSGGLKAGLPYTLRYNGTNFIVQGKGGGGNLVAADLLEGKTATGDKGQVVGSMPNNGALGTTLGINGSYTIPAGYTTGGIVTQNITTKAAATITPGTTNQTIAANICLIGIQTILGDADLATANIKAGKSIFGVAGKASVVDTYDATATAADIATGKTAYVNGVKVPGTSTAKQYAEGTCVAGTAQVNLSFQPSAIAVKYTGYNDRVYTLIALNKGDINISAGTIYSGNTLVYDPSGSGHITIVTNGFRPYNKDNTTLAYDYEWKAWE